ncbi:MAG: ATP-binding protein [Candidatus Binatia bacterium]
MHALRRHVAIRARYAPCVLRVDAVQAVAVRTDGERLHALLSHLVDAAIGRSAEACARLRVWRTDALLRFEIASVADASGAVAVAGRAAPRTPLEHLPGVIIARRLAQILGASVEVRALGDGARFDVALPVATPVAPTVH